jgi:hypothetical protein
VAPVKSADDGGRSATAERNPALTPPPLPVTVKVQYNRVVADFGNGGTVHSGMNNEGYPITGHAHQITGRLHYNRQCFPRDTVAIL